MNKVKCNTPFVHFLLIASLDRVQGKSELRIVRLCTVRAFIVQRLPISHISIFKFVSIALSRFEWLERESTPKSLI